MEKSNKQRIVFILLGIFLGTLGIHQLYIGNMAEFKKRLIIWIVCILLTVVLAMTMPQLVFIPYLGILGLFGWAIYDIAKIKTDSDGKELS